MKIKTKLKLIIIFIIVLLVGIVSMNLRLNIENKRTNSQRALLEKMSFEVFQSNQIRDEYFIYRAERSKQQWLILSPIIIKRFREMSAIFTDHDERINIEKIIDLHENISNLFNQLLGYDQNIGNHNAAGTEMRERIISQMMGLSHILYLESSKLSKAINKKADQQILYSNIFTAITFGLLGLVIIYFSRMLIQCVTYPLAKLKEGTRVVAEGNFDHRVNITSSDEIGELADDFDMMTEQLQSVTVSRDELGKEVKERKLAEEALQIQSQTFSEVLNSLDALVYVVDMNTYEILFINTYGQNTWGDIKGKICWQTIQAGQAGPCDFCTNSKIVGSDGNPAGVVAWEFQNTVNKRWFDCRDRAIYWPDGRIVRMEIATDITDRKRAAEALSNSERKYRNIFENATEGIFQSTPQGRYISVNPAFARIGGFNSPDEMRDTVTDIQKNMYVHQEDRARLLELLNKQDKVDKFEAEIRRKDNTIIWISMNVKAIRDQGGGIILLEGTMEDITNRKQAEEKIKASLLEKETMLKEIHHRVKNNLQIISSLLDLQSSYLHDEKAREMLQNSMDRVRTMAMIHTQLYQSQDLARVDFGLFIRDLIGNISQSYGRTSSPVEIHVAAGEISLGIDASIPCGLILNELVSNALKHAFPEGKEGEINIRMRLEDSRMALTVQDNGIGFPESIDLTNLKSLGLELVNILVGQMNGEIDMQVDGGTTWTIGFPVKNEREWRDG